MCGAEHFQSEIICLIFCGCSATSGFDSQMVGGRFRPEDLRGLRTAEGLHLAIPCHHFTSYHTLPLLAPCYTLQCPGIPCLHPAIPFHTLASLCTLPYPAIPFHTMLAPCHTFPYHACTLPYPAIPCFHLAIPCHHFASSITLFCWGGLHVSKMREQHQLEKATYEIQMILPSGRIP